MQSLSETRVLVILPIRYDLFETMKDVVRFGSSRRVAHIEQELWKKWRHLRGTHVEAPAWQVVWKNPESDLICLTVCVKQEWWQNKLNQNLFNS